MVRILLEYGADVSLPSGDDQDTPLHGAAMGGHTKICELLIEQGAKKDATNKEGKTPAKSAEMSGWDECAKFLAK